jgi:N-carbamoyl-L-amino-acid hydrolase
MADALDTLVAEQAERTGMPVALGARAPLAPTAMAPALMDALAGAAEATVPGRWRRMTSGALHDAASVATAGVPVGMLFVPSIGGISHSFDEDTAEADLITGAEVMADAVVRLGG